MKYKSSYTAVIPAAGIGARMQAYKPKQYLKIQKKTLLEHSVNAFTNHPLIEHIIVVVHPDDETARTILTKDVHIVVGGEERCDSVLAGVNYAHEQLQSEWVLVHDAARPGINSGLISKLIDNVKCSTGGILALPLVDTVKQISPTASAEHSNTPRVDKTLDREKIWSAQTPQMFKTAALQQALQFAIQHSLSITDEASAMEAMGTEVLLVEGHPMNFKVTKPEDLQLAEYYLAQSQLTQ
ncbi:2-C-methyl-D-erythritol 4-phosphate cytidylyltransferase [Agaribacter flavus]|uniref:2-C-methyl-D-erythritol 4-phosphate cytidylyltransferase n=1 Tax=Agaribacter flavus TaxID=1902781 RepID=A0ABV7FX34_9ALTE